MKDRHFRARLPGTALALLAALTLGILGLASSSLRAEEPPAPLSPASVVVASSVPQPLRPATAGSNERSRAVELAAREADMHTQRAFALAARGASFSSRAEFLQALRVVAQALDTDRNATAYSRALAAGLTAIREAQDFLVSGSRLEADLDLPAIVAGHRTPVLKGVDCASITPQTALQCYFTCAQ